MKIDGNTVLFGIIGNPVKHSFSPAMHNTAFKELNLNCIYAPFEVSSGNLEKAINGIRALNIKGVNITIPYKQDVIQFVDSLTDEASKIGAVNTVLNDNGKLLGDNTDGKGFIESLKTSIEPKGKIVYICGAGGASRAIVVSLLKEKVAKIYINDVVLEKAVKFAQIDSRIIPVEKDNTKIFSEIELLINASPCGMEKHDKNMPVEKDVLHKDMLIYDIVYNRETELLKTAKQKGIKSISGIEMLLYQGALAFELWTKTKAPVHTMRKVLMEVL